jgi:nitrate reductase gamma subunit
MGFIEFVHGPALQGSLLIFVAGVIFRLTALALRRRSVELSAKRAGAPSALAGALRTIVQRSWPPRIVAEQASLPTLLAYVFHVGLFVIVAFGTPHILFMAEFTGLRWAGLPKGMIDMLSGVTLGALLLALFRRVTAPVRRRLSTGDDYLSWLVTALPVVSGILLTSHLGARYETLLAIHVLSFELLLVWFPFGKLMHAFLWLPSRAATGIRYAHRGART